VICTVAPTFFSRTPDGGLTSERPRVIVPVPVNAQTIGNVIVINQQTGALFDFYDFIDVSGDLHAARCSRWTTA
jgi:hypothetical protein